MRGREIVIVSIAVVVAATSTATAQPQRPTTGKAIGKRPLSIKATQRPIVQSKARIAVSVNGATRPPPNKRRAKGPVAPADRIANEIETLYRGPLRAGTTSLYVADARSGAPLFAVEPELPLNPASNVKLISSAAALDLLGPDFRYLTRILGRMPDRNGAVGDLYLYGSYDPTLRVETMHDMATRLAGTGIKRVTGDIVVGSTATRDGIYRALIPIDLAATEPGQPVTATTPASYDFLTVVVTATTSKTRRGRLTFAEEYVTDVDGRKRLQVTIGGTLGKTKALTHWVWTKERALHAAHALRAGLRTAGVALDGDVRIAELGDVVAGATTAGWIPIELARHESAPLAAIIGQVNKRSINWLANRVIMTAAGRARGAKPSMDIAIEAMYDWLDERTSIERDALVVDTGDGLSRKTQFSAKQIVEVLRTAGGFTGAVDATRAGTFLDSLSVAGVDGTLRGRFRNNPALRNLHGKTGTLHDSIALAGILELDPERPLAFALVTNDHPTSLKVRVRNAHESVVALLCDYVKATRSSTNAVAAPKPAPPVPVKPTAAPPVIADDEEDGEDTGYPEARPDREDIEYMVQQEAEGPIVAPAPATPATP